MSIFFKYFYNLVILIGTKVTLGLNNSTGLIALGNKKLPGACGGNKISITVKPVYNDHLMRYFSVFWGSSRWPRAT